MTESIEEAIRPMYFGMKKQLDSEVELSNLFISKLSELVKAEQFVGHNEVTMIIPIEEITKIQDLNKFEELLYERPELVISSMEYSLHCIAIRDAADAEEVKDCRCVLRIKLVEAKYSIRTLKASYIGKFVSVKGTVIRVSSIKPRLVSMKFKCISCGKEEEMYFQDGKYSEVKKCSVCGNKIFEGEKETVRVKDRQMIRIQEIDEGEGRIPRSIECELVDSLVNTCVPGDVVTVSGVLKRNEDSVNKPFKKQDQTIYEPYIVTNNIENHKERNEQRNEEVIGKNDKFIEAMKQQEHLFRLLVHSLCPSIYGHNLVKAAMLLVIVGGTQKGSGSNIRRDSHMLIVGDPGLGKSQLLKSVSNIVPRGVYVSGSTSTKTGLTVSLHRNSGSSDFTIDSGALVLGDEGVCCIDEFDKMEKSQYSSLLEAMEQQSISIAKAGICCTIPSRTTVIAAANPIDGHYNRGRTIFENINMPRPLLSRFDIIFVIVDNADEESDKKLSEYIMKAHSSKQEVEKKKEKEEGEGKESISSYLNENGSESKDLLPARLMRQYLGYIKSNITAQLNNEAKEVIQKFYVELRQEYKEDEDTPITTRQLESIIRLTEARAKIECREVASKADAEEVIEIFKVSNMSGIGGSGNKPVIDFRSKGGIKGGKKQIMKNLVNILINESKKKSSKFFTKNELNEIGEELGMNDMNEYISRMNEEGYLIRQLGGYKLTL